jgi:aryl-alcohol dehydrogenase-like predicted oxidoreductase
MHRIGTSDLLVHPLALGGNVFGWTADRDTSFAVLDAYAAAGGNFLDTADSYSAWVQGNSGGESESIIGDWLASRGSRDRIVVGTKVSQHPDARGLAAATIRRAAEASLRRLRSDHIDIYWAHFDDGTPFVEMLGAFDALVREGKVRHVALSNFTVERIAEALEVADANGFARPVAVQPHYNLVHREDVEGPLADLVAREHLSLVPYFGLAKGFLTGKYRAKGTGGSPRAAGAEEYLDDRGLRVLAALDEVAAAHDAEVATVALGWLAAQPDVAAPIASARTVEQLPALLAVADLTLSDDEVKALTTASDPA